MSIKLHFSVGPLWNCPLNITAAVWNAGFHWWHSGNKKRTQNVSEYMLVLAYSLYAWLWSPYVIGQTIIFSSCFFLLSSSFFSSPNLSGRRLDVYHTLAHGVALVRI